MDIFKKIIEETSGVEINKLQKDDSGVCHVNILDLEGDVMECHFIDDWVEIKKLVMKQVAPVHRKVFSRRDPKTKNHPPLNTFEERMKNLYKEISGVDLLLRELDERREIYGRLFR